jgi:quinol monooxygenase YgiN
MVIVAGFLRVAPEARSQYLSGCTVVIRAARAAAGCVDFHLSADPIEPGRINIFEQWESVAAVEAFRGAGPSGDQQAAVLDAQVTQYEVAGSTSLT